jgi:putative DNA primase/helicase
MAKDDQISCGSSGPPNAPPQSEDVNCSDLGNSRRLVKLFGKDVRYVVETKKWIFWDGFHWLVDGRDQVQHLAKSIPNLILDEARTERDSVKRKVLLSWFMQSESASRLQAMVTLARSDPGVSVEIETLDVDPLMLGVLNGVVDLRSGKLEKPDKAHLMTKQAHVAFDAAATCPTWLAFIARISGGDLELAAYLQRVMGYILTGHTGEQCLIILYGTGANGKSIFHRVHRRLMGDYAKNTPPETLMVRSNQAGPSPELARLQGARLVIASEPSGGSRFDEATVKRLTGEDTIVCRYLYANLFEFSPTFKLVLATNHKPEIRDVDHAIWRRIQLVPFDVTIPQHEQDHQLFEKLERELPGILNWALDGLRSYQTIGLQPPAKVMKATEAYRSQMDILHDWIVEECVCEPRARTAPKVLHKSYMDWAIANDHTPLSSGIFGNELVARGFERGRTGSFRFHKGIRLKV